jgi:succinyl-diaminopimelate desuccinylase
VTSLEATLTDLVDTPSVTGSEAQICTRIASRLLPIWTMTGVQRFGNALVVGQRTGRPLITLFGHTDTVPPQGNESARVEAGRLYGLGATDMKSGLAVMIHLLEDAEVRSGAYDVIGVFYDKEEGPAAGNGLETVMDAAPWLEESELAIVLEPTDLALELGCNGALNADVMFRGSAAHSARPWLGVNAVTKAGDWLSELHARTPEPVDIRGLEYFEVFSVTSAAGGIANNVIPALFTLNLNHRFPPIYSIEEAEARLREVAAAADEVRVTDRGPAGTVPTDNPLVDRLEELAGGQVAAKQGWTDVGRLSSKGIDAVNYGPGEVALAHQPGESVPLENLDQAFVTLKTLLTE